VIGRAPRGRGQAEPDAAVRSRDDAGPCRQRPRLRHL